MGTSVYLQTCRFRLASLLSVLLFPRAAVAGARELRFASHCGLPELPAHLLAAIQSRQITLPPVAYLKNGTQDLSGLISLVGIAQAIRAKAIFEIGTFTGLTTLALALNLPDATIHTLDLPAGDRGSLRIERADHLYLPDATPRRIYPDFPALAARIVQHEADSAKFDFDGLGCQFDLVYIDGAHSYEYVKSDTEAAYRIVAPNGAIVWDDYNSIWPGVSTYLDEQARPGTFCLPMVPRRLAVWFGDTQYVLD